MAQLDIFGLPVAVQATKESGPAQGLMLIDHEATQAQQRNRSRLVRALQHFAQGITLLWSTDLQAWRLPPLSHTELLDALEQCQGMQRSLAGIVEKLQDEINEGGR